MHTLANNSEFVARKEEVSFVGSFISDAINDTGCFKSSVFLLQAPSGAGKSRLINECFGRFPEVVHLRVDVRHHHGYRGFRSEFLQTIIVHYRSIIRSGNDAQLSDWMWSAPRNRKSIGDAFSSLADGVTFGGLTAFKSLLSVVNSKTSAHIEELFAEQNQLEDWIEKLIVELGQRFAIAISVSNAQELNSDDLAYLIQICSKAQHFLTLEFTTDNFQHGVIERENIASLTSQEGSKVAALVLGPLKWSDAKTISHNLGEDDDWARCYYEQHGFNLFDLKNLSNPDGISFESICVSDFSFGPSILPGIKNRYPATRQKIIGLSRDEQMVLCIVYLHGGYATGEDLDVLLAGISTVQDSVTIKNSLVQNLELLKNSERNQSFRLTHDSISAAIDDSLELLPLVKIAAKQWQGFYQKKFEEALARGVREPAFECSIKLAYFSALNGSNDALLEACQSIYKLSRYVSMKGDARNTFQFILDKMGTGSLVPKKLQPVIAYYLGASAINFQDLHLASEVLSTMDMERFGANILSVFVYQKRDEFQASNRILASLQTDIAANLETEDRCLLDLVSIINQHSIAGTSKEIEVAKDAYRRLATESSAFPGLEPIILKHASIGYGFRESIPLLKSSIRRMERSANYFEVAQAKLVLLMQLTRLGHITSASQQLSEIRDAFPKDFAEEANLLNIEALLICFSTENKGVAVEPARELFQRAQRVCRDEYRKLVLASNLFVYDHFIAPPSLGSSRMKDSRDELLHLLDTSTIGFRYLYVLGYYNLMRYYESIDDSTMMKLYRRRLGKIDDSDSLLWRCAMGLSDPVGTEVEFLVSTPYMLAFLPNYQVSPPSFLNRVDRISEIISR
ncbi:hypothetical protein [Coralliovum pocilloporae]|uniref:hypothetical protein n=1 Tax=Coralliovum pocilloporae TaxID=3066369 RepID=UPI0033079503